MTIHRLVLSALGGLLIAAGTAAAQVDTWALTYPILGIEDRISISWSTVGTDNGATVTTLPFPSCIGGVAMSADRSTFHVLAGTDLLRFDTASRSQLASLPAPVPCEQTSRMYISPDDRWWYFFGGSPRPTRSWIVNAATQAVVVDATIEPLAGFALSPDGNARFELVVVGYGPLDQPNAWRLRAKSSPESTATIWEVPLQCDWCGVTITANAVAVYVRVNQPFAGVQEVRAYDVRTGIEGARAPLPSVFQSMRAGRDEIFVAGTREVSGTCGENVAAALDMITLAQRRSASFPADCLYTFSGFVLSQDESILYLATSRGSIIGTLTRAEAFATASFRPLAAGTFIRFPTYAARAIGPPSPEIVALTASSGGVAVDWQPAIGEAPLAFTIRGALRGHATTPVGGTGPAERRWTSPPLPDGSYTVEVAALNLAASSTPSPAVDFGVGNAGLPQPPINIVAATQADVSHLTWRPSPAGPAPSEYIIQAAFAGTNGFVDVTRVSLPELRATRIPAGSWDVRVRAVTATGLSGPSQVVTVTTAPCSTPPSAPAALNAIVTGRTVTLRWIASAGGAEEYIIEAGTTAGAIDIGRLPTASPRPSIDVAAPRGDYFVRLRARNACGESAISGEIRISVD